MLPPLQALVLLSTLGKEASLLWMSMLKVFTWRANCTHASTVALPPKLTPCCTSIFNGTAVLVESSDVTNHHRRQSLHRLEVVCLHVHEVLDGGGNSRVIWSKVNSRSIRPEGGN